MTDTDREMLRTTFGEDAELYDRCRPRYPPQLFADLAELAGLGPHARVLEIGCGTGQATLPLAQRGCTVVAMDLSPDMAAIARRNLAPFPNVTVVASAFEDWQPSTGPFDAVLSATAFHWLDPDVRMIKAADLLRPAGVLGIVSTHHIAGGTNAFFADAQRCYERFDPATPPGMRLTSHDETADEAAEFERSARFGPVEFRRYDWQQTYTADEYLDLLMTYSGHRAMKPQARRDLFACIAHLIDNVHGGRITKQYRTRLALAVRTR
ncbi:methyltransferase type 11 [Actinoplanes philippinensis]|uniref:Methyltransferase domain-containing protein n=1 Tax=Actinoplanes philippinensis TaxID=35752 RepID=A0A1I2I9V5_9ACTN|nr:class I SAM-dependent methyltransferase [Actinoplanes philippinensis]GIE78563.1 methyltransferase type 11 [Actinoplanes philippinensis]SFF37907.1 Methyltransferase domain-containing protein [Actinoplanes philippinensis]